MEPTYDKNDVVFVIPKEQYNIGDVITYKKDNESKSLAFNDFSKDPIIIKRPPKKPKKPLWDFDDLM